MWPLVGAVVGLLAWYQSQDPVARRIALIAAIAFAGLFLLLGGIDVTEIIRRHSTAGDLADLQRTAKKRYTEWWAVCQDPVKSAAIEAESEKARLKIMEVLKQRLGEAEAQDFNTPKAVEPFPNTTLRNCPQAVLINEFAHRIDRLGDIIRKLREQKR